MSHEYPLTLHQVDEARADFAAIESDLEFVMGQLAKLPTRRKMAKTVLAFIISTAAVVILWAEAFWRL